MRQFALNFGNTRPRANFIFVTARRTAYAKSSDNFTVGLNSGPAWECTDVRGECERLCGEWGVF